MGKHQDSLFDDTITLRIYEEEELLQKLNRNGFKVLDKSLINKTTENLESWFILVQKCKEYKTDKKLSWLQNLCEDKIYFTENHMYYGLTEKYLTEGKKDLAIKTLQELVKCNPHHMEGWLELISILIEEKRVDDAISSLQRMLEANPTYYKGYVSLIQLLRFKGRKTEAVEVYNLLKKHQTDILESLSLVGADTQA